MTQNYGPIKNIDRYLGARVYEKIAGERFVERVALVDSALAEMQTRLIKMRGIAVKSSGGLLSDEERAECQRSVDVLKKEIDGLASLISQDDDHAIAGKEMDRTLSSAAEILNELKGFGDQKDPGAANGSGGAPSKGSSENGLDDEDVADWMRSLM
jgi:flagellin-like hook-associated protein FlgL